VVSDGGALTDHNPVLTVNGGPTDGFLMLAASFGGAPQESTKTPLVLVNPVDACQPLQRLNGAIAFAERDSLCFIIDRARNAQAAGASAIVIRYDQDGGIPVSYVALNDGGVTVTIPVYGVSREDGAVIEGLIGNGTPTASISTTTRRAGTNSRGDVLMYTPSILKQGSTLSHWDTTASPSLLMEPQITPQIPRDLDITPASLEDVGWSVQHALSIGATKLGQADLFPGEPARFLVQVVNRGLLPSSGVVVDQQPDPGLAFASNSLGCTTSFPCTFDVVEPGGVRTFISQYTPQGSPNSVTAGFSITAGGDSTNPTATVTALAATAADISVTGSGPATGQENGSADVVFTVKNNGPGTAVSSTLAASVDLGGSITGYSGDCTGSSQCALGDVASGQSKAVHVAVKWGSSAGTATVTGTGGSAASDPNSANNSATVKTSIANSSGCSVTGNGFPLLVVPALLLWARRRGRVTAPASRFPGRQRR
jgi:uncharacterized repeat protein (TIGR01451 family)